MTIDDCRALCWATVVLLFSIRVMLISTATASAAHVPIRPYRLTLLRRHGETGSTKPEVEFRDIVVRRQQPSARKVAATVSAVVKPQDGADRDVGKLLSVVAFLKAVAEQAKPRVARDIKRKTAALEKALAKRRKSRQNKRGVNKAQVVTIYTSGLPSTLARQRSNRSKTDIAAARQANEYHSDDNHDQSYHDPGTDPYSEYPETSYSEDAYQGDDGGYADQYNHEYTDATYSEDPYHDTPEYQESSYHETGSSDEYDYHQATETGHSPGYEQNSYEDSSYSESDTYHEAPNEEHSYEESGSSDYHANQDSGYEGELYPHEEGYDTAAEDDYAAESYPQEPEYHDNSHEDSSYSDTYHETPDEEQYQQPSYDESESSDYHQNQDSGYEEDSYPTESHEEGYETAAEGDYTAESYPEDSEYDDAQPYQPSHEEPEYHENSYEPDYQPTYSASSSDDSTSYDHESSHNTDYDCPTAPGKSEFTLHHSAKQRRQSSRTPLTRKLCYRKDDRAMRAI